MAPQRWLGDDRCTAAAPDGWKRRYGTAAAVFTVGKQNVGPLGAAMVVLGFGRVSGLPCRTPHACATTRSATPPGARSHHPWILRPPLGDQRPPTGSGETVTPRPVGVCNFTTLADETDATINTQKLHRRYQKISGPGGEDHCIPGFSNTVAEVFIAETGADMTVFPTSKPKESPSTTSPRCSACPVPPPTDT